MRKLLFRGKRADNGEWIEGNGFDYTYDDAFISLKDHDESVGYCGVVETEVIPETVGQYTNVEDFAGLEIFEGDVVKFKDHGKSLVGVVQWDNYGLFIVVVRAWGWRGLWQFIDIEKNCATLEVIGNVHDNPELLERDAPEIDADVAPIQTVHIPSCDNHEGVYAIDVRLRWRCPICGKPRGKITRGRSYDGSLCLDVDTWVNSCGHVDKYADVRREAAENGLNIVTEVIPSDHGEGGDV